MCCPFLTIKLKFLSMAACCSSWLNKISKFIDNLVDVSIHLIFADDEAEIQKGKPENVTESAYHWAGLFEKKFQNFRYSCGRLSHGIKIFIGNNSWSTHGRPISRKPTQIASQKHCLSKLWSRETSTNWNFWKILNSEIGIEIFTRSVDC